MLLRQILSENLLSTTPGTTFNIRNTRFFNILRANSFFAIFYADFFRCRDANSSTLKDLELRSRFFFDPDRSPKNPSTSQTGKGTASMAERGKKNKIEKKRVTDDFLDGFLRAGACPERSRRVTLW
jgi:hypothetical protein